MKMSSRNILEDADLTQFEVEDAVRNMNDGSNQLNNLAEMFNNRSSVLGLNSGTFEALHGKHCQHLITF